MRKREWKRKRAREQNDSVQFVNDEIEKQI